MNAIKDGGPAFPQHIDGVHYAEAGMSLRDYFAAKAMNGICAASPGSEWTDARIAQGAYELADAMLAEREKAQP